MSTIRDVARLAQVSISTVSLALNEPERVSAETRARVDKAAREVGYTANPVAKSLKRGRSQLIGMVVSDITNPFFGKLLLEVERSAMDAGFMVVVADTAGKQETERAILRHLSGQLVAGIILSPCGLYQGEADHIQRLGMPFVLFDHAIEGVSSDFVGTDNHLASAMLTEHLIRLGHRRIAYIGGIEGVYTSVGRKAGYADTLRASGIPVDPALIADGRYQGEAAYEIAMRFLTMSSDRPTALLCASNVMALGALQACNDLSVVCPDEVSLAGIDDVPWSSVIRPRITMAVQPVKEMALAASRLLMARIGAPDVSVIPFERVVLASKLVIGESTCPPRVAPIKPG